MESAVMTIESANSKQDRYRGVMAGLAVGDAMGMPLEFLTREEIRARYGCAVRDYVRPKSGHPCERLRPGQYTDDTQMALALAKAIIDKGGYDPHAFKRRLIEWHNCKDHRAPGRTCIESAYRLVQGLPYKEAGERDAAGCGSAMRVAPLALVYDEKELVKHSNSQSIMTHRDARASIGSILTAYIVNKLLKHDAAGFDRFAFLKMIIRLAEIIEEKFNFKRMEFSLLLKEFPALLDREFEDGITRIGTSGYVVQTVLAAFYAFLHDSADFETCIVNAVNQGGDADSIGAIAGAFSGALNGIISIPERWLCNLENREYIIKIADDLHTIAETR
jgi:ADP-ribosylglycohydrolase